MNTLANYDLVQERQQEARSRARWARYVRAARAARRAERAAEAARRAAERAGADGYGPGTGRTFW